MPGLKQPVWPQVAGVSPTCPGGFVTGPCILTTIFFTGDEVCGRLVWGCAPGRAPFPEVRKRSMRSTRKIKGTFVGILALVAASAGGQTGSGQFFALDTVTGLDARSVKLEAAEFQGRKAVRLTTDANDGGLALLHGSDLQDGTIEADLAVKITTPPGVRMPGFTGIAFRAKADGSEFQVFYLRPKNALAEDQGMRNHTVQYVAEPGYGWYRLRREWPFVYESYADIQPETWIHLKIEISGRTARIFLNGGRQPSLVVDGLKSSLLRGEVGLWGYAGEESYFANVRITPAAAQAVRNGADAAGEWTVRYSSDAGPFEGSMKLTRDGNKVSGTWSGGLGNSKSISGTWRDGYVELQFSAEWPEGRDGAPGPATAYLEGWIDDTSAKGRMRVEGRSDGRWVAERKIQ